MSTVHYTALRSAWNRVNAQKIVDEIILNCSVFKIGKTGDTLDDRLNNYKGEYNHIDSVFLGGELEVEQCPLGVRLLLADDEVADEVAGIVGADGRAFLAA